VAGLLLLGAEMDKNGDEIEDNRDDEDDDAEG